jgi:hypothetical protein
MMQNDAPTNERNCFSENAVKGARIGSLHARAGVLTRYLLTLKDLSR